MVIDAVASEPGSTLQARADRAARCWWDNLPPDQQSAFVRRLFENHVPYGERRGWWERAENPEIEVAC